MTINDDELTFRKQWYAVWGYHPFKFKKHLKEYRKFRENLRTLDNKVKEFKRNKQEIR